MMKRTLLSIIKILLVIALVVGICLSLVKLAEWKDRKPVIKPDAQGNIFLEAADASIAGIGTARYNILNGVKNIGWWDHTTQSLQWRFIANKQGLYEVKLNYALPSGLETDFVLSVNDHQLNCVITSTGGWDQWLEVSLGQINLTASQPHIASIKPLRTTGGVGIMNLCKLHLKPITIAKQE